jgi:hypothetical protein
MLQVLLENKTAIKEGEALFSYPTHCRHKILTVCFISTRLVWREEGKTSLTTKQVKKM